MFCRWKIKKKKHFESEKESPPAVIVFKNEEVLVIYNVSDSNFLTPPNVSGQQLYYLLDVIMNLT